MMDYGPAIATILALATALIGYTGVIQKEREHGRLRPLFSTRFRRDGAGPRIVIVNEGGQPALGVRFEGCGRRMRRDVMKAGERVELPIDEGAGCDLTILYQGLSRPRRRAIRRFVATTGGDVEYVGGEDQALGALNRFRSER